MPKKKVPEEIIFLFTVITGKVEGWFPDGISVNQMVIESNTCPYCWKPLEYRGLTDYRIMKNYGVCMNCQYAKHFWDEGEDLVNAKKAICKRINESRAERQIA